MLVSVGVQSPTEIKASGGWQRCADEDVALLCDAHLADKYAEAYLKKITEQKGDMEQVVATMAVHNLSKYLYRYYGKKVIILLDEYDTPMQEAYINGFWDELAAFTRSLFNSTFKTNPYLERAIKTGINW